MAFYGMMPTIQTTATTPMSAISIEAIRDANSDPSLLRRFFVLAMRPADANPEALTESTPLPIGIAEPSSIAGAISSFSGAFDHPMDAEDFARCRLLLERMPAVAERFRGIMPSASPIWRSIVAAWDDLGAALDAECPAWRTQDVDAPNTTTMIRQIIRRSLIGKPGKA